ncbi:hypothetical protein AAZV13_15G145300 [Glycine max]
MLPRLNVRPAWGFMLLSLGFYRDFDSATITSMLWPGLSLLVVQLNYPLAGINFKHAFIYVSSTLENKIGRSNAKWCYYVNNFDAVINSSIQWFYGHVQL